MKTTQDLINWLDQNGHKEGADDIRRMQTDEEYAKHVDFEEIEESDIKTVLLQSFFWGKSDNECTYWDSICRLLP